jgi:pimeloyl-ACP methyl ester carboxylesterase
MAVRGGFAEADGVRLRYLESGQGSPLVHLHDAGARRLTPAHELLSRRHRVVALEMPGSGGSHEPTRAEGMSGLASTVARAIASLGLTTYDLMGTSFGATTALWMALQAPDRVLALILESPAGLRPEGAASPTGPDHDAELESRLPGIATPTLVLFGTLDRVVSPEMGRVYPALMPNAHLVFVYAAGHDIAAERPAAFAEVVEDFLERHEAFVISRAQTVIHP